VVAALLAAGGRDPQNTPAIAFDAAPFGIPLQDEPGVMWEEPREIHSVTVDFAGVVPTNRAFHLEYWGSRWPEQYLPKDREPGGGDAGWTELGNWFNGGWRVADSEQGIDGNSLHFSFLPINAHEFPNLKDYSSSARFTLKVRITGDPPLPKILRIQAMTDSTMADRTVRIVWARPRTGPLRAEAFNGQVLSVTATNSLAASLRVRVAVNPDPNTFDRTLVSVFSGTNTFTFKVDDLQDGALYLPELGAAVLSENDPRDYAAVAGDVVRAGQRTLYDRVAELPEQTWTSAWNGMPPKKSRICFILAMDGARQKFRLDRNGDILIRWNDQYMRAVAADDTRRLDLEKPPVLLQFSLPDQPVARHIQEDSIPTCITTWQRDGLRITQTAFATTLGGVRTNAAPPPDACAVAMLRFEVANTTSRPLVGGLPITLVTGGAQEAIRLDGDGLLWHGGFVRGQVISDPMPVVSSNRLLWSAPLAAQETKALTVKFPFVVLTQASETKALAALEFASEQKATADYWRAVLDRGAKLVTPEPALDNFYRAVAAHLLINCEGEPNSSRRFARVGSLNYGVYGNESCMMVLDLDRRGYHQQAENCLETWLRYQGTVGLPGNFDSKEGVFHGAAGYEAVGYNQHHGWILWALAEHYRFTRDDPWLRRVATSIVSGADWIIRETTRTTNRQDLAEGLLPPGDLEDIGDWWTWLSTSCYTWRGLDSAAWALEQIQDPQAPRIRTAANVYHTKLLEHFLAASARAPVVRLRDGTAVSHIPSSVQRRGRSFGWICETLEGAIHLVITKALDPQSARALWILKDYEDNLFLSNQYGYTLEDFDKDWFGRGGMSMQACLLLDVEPYLYRDDVKQALRAMFNAIALNYFPDVHMLTEHALPEMGDWRGDHYKTSDEANACGWLRYLFVREEGDVLLLGQAVPREWLTPGQTCGIQNTATYFGDASILYHGGAGSIAADLRAPTRNPPREIRLRFRVPGGRPVAKVTVNGQLWKDVDGDWVLLPGNIGNAAVIASY
jgi:hypothetical protein